MSTSDRITVSTSETLPFDDCYSAVLRLEYDGRVVEMDYFSGSSDEADRDEFLSMLRSDCMAGLSTPLEFAADMFPEDAAMTVVWPMWAAAVAVVDKIAMLLDGVVLPRSSVGVPTFEHLKAVAPRLTEFLDGE